MLPVICIDTHRNACRGLSGLKLHRAQGLGALGKTPLPRAMLMCGSLNELTRAPTRALSKTSAGLEGTCGRLPVCVA